MHYQAAFMLSFSIYDGYGFISEKPPEGLQPDVLMPSGSGAANTESCVFPVR